MHGRGCGLGVVARRGVRAGGAGLGVAALLARGAGGGVPRAGSGPRSRPGPCRTPPRPACRPAGRARTRRDRARSLLGCRDGSRRRTQPRERYAGRRHEVETTRSSASLTVAISFCDPVIPGLITRTEANRPSVQVCALIACGSAAVGSSVTVVSWCGLVALELGELREQVAGLVRVELLALLDQLAGLLELLGVGGVVEGARGLDLLDQGRQLGAPLLRGDADGLHPGAARVPPLAGGQGADLCPRCPSRGPCR